MLKSDLLKFILADGSRGGVHNGWGGVAAGCRGKKWRDHILSHRQEVDKANRKWGQNVTLRAHPH